MDTRGCPPPSHDAPPSPQTAMLHSLHRVNGGSMAGQGTAWQAELITEYFIICLVLPLYGGRGRRWHPPPQQQPPCLKPQCLKTLGRYSLDRFTGFIQSWDTSVYLPSLPSLKNRILIFFLNVPFCLFPVQGPRSLSASPLGILCRQGVLAGDG